MWYLQDAKKKSSKKLIYESKAAQNEGGSDP